MSTGLIIMIAVLMAIANAAYPAEIIGANACRRARSLARGCRTGSRAQLRHIIFLPPASSCRQRP
jgi:hypothetical protein